MSGRNLCSEQRCLLGELWSLWSAMPGRFELSLAVWILLHPLGCPDGTCCAPDRREAIQYGLGSGKYASHTNLSTIRKAISWGGGRSRWPFSCHAILAQRYGAVRCLLCAWSVVTRFIDLGKPLVGCRWPIVLQTAVAMACPLNRDRVPVWSGSSALPF